MRLLRHVGRGGFPIVPWTLKQKRAAVMSELLNAPELLLADHLPQVLDDELA